MICVWSANWSCGHEGCFCCTQVGLGSPPPGKLHSVLRAEPPSHNRHAVAAMSGAQFGPLWTELNPPLSQKSLDVLERLGFERAAPVQVGYSCSIHDVANSAAVALCALSERNCYSQLSGATAALVWARARSHGN